MPAAGGLYAFTPVQDLASLRPQVFARRVSELDWLLHEPSRIRQSPLFEVRGTHHVYAP